MRGCPTEGTCVVALWGNDDAGLYDRGGMRDCIVGCREQAPPGDSRHHVQGAAARRTGTRPGGDGARYAGARHAGTCVIAL